MSGRPTAPFAAGAALLAIALMAGCALAGQSHVSIPSDEPSVRPSGGDTAIPSGGDGQTYDGQLLGFTIADVEAIAADLGLECVEEPENDGFYFDCMTSASSLETPEWFAINARTSGEEAYILIIVTSTAPPNEQASRDAAADIAETLMPWITDLGWYRSGNYYCGPGRHPVPEFDNFGPDYSICGSSSPDAGGDGITSSAELGIVTDPWPWAAP